MRRVVRRAPMAAFVVAGLISALFAGIVIEQRDAFPSNLLARAQKTWDTMRRTARTQAPTRFDSNQSISNVPRNAAGGPSRIQFVDGNTLDDPILFVGGYMAFNEYCPAPAVGCLAVEYAGGGQVVETWPYYPDSIFPAHGEGEGYLEFKQHEIPIGWSAVHNTGVMDAVKYDNGDLLVVYHFDNTFPYAGGMARVDRRGSLIWHRRDYAHHSLSMVDSSHVWVPGQRLEQKDNCVALLDVARLIDGTGAVVREVEVTAAVATSPWERNMRIFHDNWCDPTHMNSVHEVGLVGGEGDGLFKTGDLIVSLRNLNAFGILDRDSHHLNHVVRGSFRAQHDVVHVSGSKFIMFDNLGTGLRLSRALIVDPVQGTEVSVFPAAGASGFLPRPSIAKEMARLYTETGGHISVSPDRKRAIATFDGAGRAVEFRIADGEVVTIFDGFHDIPSSEDGTAITRRLDVRFVGYSREARPSDASNRQ